MSTLKSIEQKIIEEKNSEVIDEFVEDGFKRQEICHTIYAIDEKGLSTMIYEILGDLRNDLQKREYMVTFSTVQFIDLLFNFKNYPFFPKKD